MLLLLFHILCRAALHGRCPCHGSVQTQAAPAQIGDPGETGEDADGGSRGHQATGTGNKGAVAVDGQCRMQSSSEGGSAETDLFDSIGAICLDSLKVAHDAKFTLRQCFLNNLRL